jgi:hypothetical protein
MKIIIAGSRSITDFNIVKKVTECCPFFISEIVSGGAKGIDKLGEKYATEKNLPLTIFKSLWNNLEAPNAIIKENRYGKYNARAGIDRNEKMGNYADGLIAIWDGSSKGTRHMIEYMKKIGKEVFVYKISGE